MQTIRKPIWHYHVMGSNRGDMGLNQSIHDLIHRFIDVPIANFSVQYQTLTAAKINQMNNEASMLLIGGSGLYSNYRNSPSEWYFPCETELFKKIKVPIVLYAVGSNKHLKYDTLGELSLKAIKSIKEINRLASLSSVRDMRTFKILQDAGVLEHHLIADPACFLEPLPPKNLLPKKLVAINFIDYSPMLKHYSPDLVYLACHLCKSLKSRGYSVIFVAHDCLEHSFYLKIKENFPELLYYNEDNPKEMVYIYSKADFSIGVRCHSNIFSFAGNTPMISLIYDVKQSEFMRSIEMEDYALRIDKGINIKDILLRVDNIERNGRKLRKKLGETRNQFFNTEFSFVTKIVELIK